MTFFYPMKETATFTLIWDQNNEVVVGLNWVIVEARSFDAANQMWWHVAAECCSSSGAVGGVVG